MTSTLKAMRAWNRPVLVLNCRIGGLAIMRSLGRLGAPVYGVDADADAPALRSRFCAGHWHRALDPVRPESYLDFVLERGRELGPECVLIPTSDDLAMFVATHAEALSEFFVFPRNSPELLRDLADKARMFRLAVEHDIPVPLTVAPQSLEEVLDHLDRFSFPLMLKGIDGRRLQLRTGRKMVVVGSHDELLARYREMEDPTAPNLMLQELIPGDDDRVFIFNGYFDGASACHNGFTGHKIRQFPVHVGSASLGICTRVPEVEALTTRLMRTIGYRGILDIGYRLDPRDGRYKVLDINPRVGQAFRMFVAHNDMDVVKSLYLDLTGQEPIASEPREGRKWLVEDHDIVSTWDYMREGTLSVGQWLRSFRGLEEAAWFDLGDLRPFLGQSGRFSRYAFGALGRRIKRVGRPLPRAVPASVDG